MQSWKRSTTISGIKFHSPRGYYLATIQLTRSQNDSGFDIVYQQETRNWMSYELKKSLVFLFLTFVSINRFPWTFQFSFASLARRKLFLMSCSEPNNLLATFQTSTGPWALVKSGLNCLRHFKTFCLRLHHQTAKDYLRERLLAWLLACKILKLHFEVSLTQISRILKYSVAGVMLYFYLQSFSVNWDRGTPKNFGEESRLGKGIKNILN